MDRALTAQTIRLTGEGGADLEAYLASPHGDDRRGGMVFIHHLPGYDRETKEFVRRAADAGYDALCPNLYSRVGRDVAPDDAAAQVRAEGGVPDGQVMGDVRACVEHLRSLPTSNGKVAVIGHCSGGRQTFLAAATLPIDAAIVCYGGMIAGDGPPPQLPSMVPLLDRAPDVGCPVLGLFGNDDQFPTPAQVDEIDKALTDAGKEHEFHRYDGAGHAFFSPDRPAYRVEAALDGWERIWAFTRVHLGG
ncbi:MAG TPA: dienelactone hydrolase family protein [Mycobacteriales bacterium]|nr:dienelactone hydrolase family protein [Mycobacteriales bacterium]